MKDSILNNILQIICKNQNYSKDKRAELRYGLEALYLNITKLIVLLFLSLLIGILKETCLFFLFYALIRTFAFGLHVKNSSWCWVLSILAFIILPFLSTIIIPNIYFNFFVLVLCFFNFLIYAPADTKKRPLVNKKKRIIYKIITIIICIVYSIAIMYIKDETIINLIIFALLIAAITTNKLSYKIINEPFNNYKSYKV